MDPYEVLGLSRQATRAQIQAAYRRLARLYHPDSATHKLPKAEASRRMAAINAAYAALKQKPAPLADDALENAEMLDQAEAFIERARLVDAERILEGCLERSARWYALKGVILMRRQRLPQAEAHFRTACQLDSDNVDYARLLHRIKTVNARQNATLIHKFKHFVARSMRRINP